MGTAPPALILLLSRLCLDFQESTISYVVCAIVVEFTIGFQISIIFVLFVFQFKPVANELSVSC